MSNIEENLKKILESVYGKDVRQAIHDGIHNCYKDGKAGAVDLIARERINELQKIPEGGTSADAALNDIKIGYDGTAYETPGDAVREQVGSLTGDIENAGIKEIIDPDWGDGYVNNEGYLNTSNPGGAVYTKTPIKLNVGETIVVAGEGYLTNVSIVSEYNNLNGTIVYVPKVISEDGKKVYKYTADKNIEVSISIMENTYKSLYIIKSISTSDIENLKVATDLTTREEIIDKQYIEVGELLNNTQAQKLGNGILYLGSGEGYTAKKLTITDEKRLRVTCFATQSNQYGFGYCCVGLNNIIIDQYNDTDGKYTVEFDIPDGTLAVYANDNNRMDSSELKIENVIVEKELKRVSYTKEESDSRYEIIPFFDLSLFSEQGVVGDSYASGELYYSGKYVDKYNISWGQILARKHGVNFTNFSRGGMTTRTWLTDGGRGLEYLKTSGQKDIYYLVLGINDYYHLGESYLGSMSDITDHTSYSEYGDTFYGNYGKIIEEIQSHAPKAKMIIFTVASTEELPEKFNKAIMDIAGHYNIPYIVQSEDGFFQSEVYTNMVMGHPTAIGYGGMAAAFERLINNCVVRNLGYFRDCFMYD